MSDPSPACTRCQASLTQEEPVRGQTLCAKCAEEVTIDSASQVTINTEAPPPQSASSPFSAQFLKEYTMVRKLGAGGMGAVYLMQETNLDRPVAVKVLHAAQAKVTRVDRFLQEARLVAKLDHPNIVRVYHIGEDHGPAGVFPYMVGEYVPGSTLSDRLRHSPPLTHDQVVDLMRQILDGLHAAHEANIIHRDLKPDNILLTRDGRPKIADFGLARSVDLPSATALGTIMGTPAYMSPEQCSGQPAGRESDVYSLGVMLFLLTTGRLPFFGPSPTEFLEQHRRQPLPPARAIRPEISKAMEDILEKCLRKNPAERYRSCEEFSYALAELGSTARTVEEVVSHTPGAIEVGVRLAGRYELVRPLGEGNMGQVWLGRDHARGKVEVAVKLLPPELWKDDQARNRLVDEANVSLKLTHPNLIRLFNLEPGDPPFLVMEFVSGQTLAEDLKRRRMEGNPAMSVTDAVPLIDGLAAGLDYAHQRDVIHRDVKPANVLLEPDPEGGFTVKIADFGIAAQMRDFQQKERAEIPAGSLAYMSPEQLAQDPLDARTDVYALGVVLFEILAGELPFSGPDLARKVANERPVIPRTVPDAIGGVILAALAKSPSQRPSTAGTLANQFRNAVQQAYGLTPRAAAPRGTSSAFLTSFDPAGTMAEGGAVRSPTIARLSIATVPMETPLHPSAAPASRKRSRTGSLVFAGFLCIGVVALVLRSLFTGGTAPAQPGLDRLLGSDTSTGSLLLATEEHLAARRFKEAVDCAKKALAQDPTQEGVYPLLAQALVETQQLNEARTVLLAAKEKILLRPTGWLWLADVEQRLGNKAQMARAAQEARSDPALVKRVQEILDRGR